MFVEEAVQRVLGIPVVGNRHAVAVLAVVVAGAIVPPQAVTRLGVEGDVVVVGIGLGTLVVHRHVDIALPGEVLDQRLGMDDLGDARQLHGARRGTVDQSDLALLGRLQRLGDLTGDVILLDEQLLVAFQRGNLVPLQRDRTAVFGLDKQLAAIEHADLAGEAIAILQPHGVGERRQGNGGKGRAKQGSGEHKCAGIMVEVG